MIKFRSPLLKSFPTPKTGINYALRFVLVLFVLSSISAIVVSVYLRVFDKNGSGFLLYWIHDNFYLLIKGYTYYLYYPTCIFAWSVLFIFFVLWLISYLTNLTAIRPVHMMLIKDAIRHIKWNPIVTFFFKGFHKSHFKQSIFKTVLDHERKMELNRLISCSPKKMNKVIAPTVVRLTQLHTKILTLTRSSHEDHLNAYSFQFQTILYLHFQLQHNKKQLKKLIKELLHDNKTQQAMYSSIIYGKDSDLTESLFSLANLVKDLELVTELIQNDATDQEMLKKLFHSVNTRSALLAKGIKQLEHVNMRNTKKEMYNSIDLFEMLPAENKDAQLAGQLTMGLALHASMLTDTPQLALTTLEFFEFLSFQLHLIPQQINNEKISRLYYYTKENPGPDAYKLCADLNRTQFEHIENQWKNSFMNNDKLVASSVFDLNKHQVSSLYQAVGTAYNQ